MKTTLQVVANAIRANGKPQAFGSNYDINGAACALQQGADNLRVDFTGLFEELNNFFDYDREIGLGEAIVQWNDHDYLSLSAIADRIETDYAEYLAQSVRVD